MPIVTTIKAIMSPLRLRSSMNREEIMAPLGTHDPRWSLEAPSVFEGTGSDAEFSVTVEVVIVTRLIEW